MKPIFASLYTSVKPHLAFSIDNSDNASKSLIVLYDDLSTLLMMHEEFTRLTPADQRTTLIELIKEKLSP